MKQQFAVVFAMMIVGCTSASKNVEQPAPAPTTAPVAAPKAEVVKVVPENGKEVRCKLGKDERILMLQLEKSGCELIYTRYAEDSSAARSKNGTDYCVQVRDNIQKNLEGSGFKCK